VPMPVGKNPGPHPETGKTIVVLPLAALVLASSMWFFFDYILGPGQIRQAALHGTPRGNLSDLYPRWLGARELLRHGRDPYSQEITRDIQAGYYGRSIDPSRPADPQDQQGFAYPVYVVFLLAPLIGLPFGVVREIFNVLVWALTAGSVFLWLRVLNWRPPRAMTLVFCLLTLGSLPAVQGIKLQQLTLVVAALLSAASAAVAGGNLILAGFLLALATVKPQLAVLPVFWFTLWSLYDWQKRQRFFWSFSATMLALLGGAQALSPGWLGRFVIALANYHRYTQNESILGTLLGPRTGQVLGGVLVLISLLVLRRFLPARGDSPAMGAAVSLVMALTVVVVPMTAPYNQVLLLPAILCLTRYLPQFPAAGRWLRLAAGVVFGLLFWPWIASLALSVASLGLPPERVQQGWKLAFLTLFALPLLVFLLLAAWMTKSRLHAQATEPGLERSS